jgi:hypothetical protein
VGIVSIFLPGLHVTFAVASVLAVTAMSVGLELATQAGPRTMQRNPVATRVVLLIAVLVALAVWIVLTEP